MVNYLQILRKFLAQIFVNIETVHLQIHAGMNFSKNSCWHEFFFHVGMNFFISRNSCWHEFSQNHWFRFLTPYLGHQTSQNPLPHHFWGDAPLQSRLPYINSISQLLVSVGTLQSWSVVFELSFDSQYQPTLYKSRLV